MVRPSTSVSSSACLQPLERLVPGLPVRDQLGDHRVVADADLVSLLDARVHADRLRKPQPLDPTCLGEEGLRVLRIEPHLDGVALEPRRGRIDPLALRDSDLLLDEIHAGNRFGDGMLDLDAAVQLQEEEIVPVEHELRGARTAVVDRAREGDRRSGHPLAQPGREDGRLLQHLLVASLDRALALAQRDDRALSVREKLDLDVARPLDVALAEDAVVPEGGLGLALRRLERLLQLSRRADDAHPAPAAAGRSLDDQREPDLFRLPGRHHGNACLRRDPLRLQLVPAGVQRLRRRPDEYEPGRFDRLREIGTFGQESVPGVDRVRARLLRGADLLLREEVAEHLDRLVRRACVQRAGVVRRDDGDGGDPQLPAGAEDTERDLAAVCDEQLADQRTRAGVCFRPARAALSAKRIIAAGIFCARWSVCSSADAKYSMSASVTVSDGMPLSTFM